MKILRALLVLFAPVAALAAGCAEKKELTEPEVLVSPYSVGTARLLWAVAPLRNESGTSAADTFMVSDALVARTAEIRGLACLPLNRTIAAMRSLGLSEVATPGDARKLAQALGCDGIIAGTITAYDPYDPPTLGLTIGLYPRDGSALTSVDGAIDPRRLRSSPVDGRAGAPPLDRPLSVAAEHLDSKNQEVQLNLRRYADGRHDANAPLGWRRYMASMDLYADFAAFWTLRQLLDAERLRMAREGRPPSDSSR